MRFFEFCKKLQDKFLNYKKNLSSEIKYADRDSKAGLEPESDHLLKH